MNCGQGGEIIGETAVREERTVEGAVEVVSKTPIAANDGLVYLPCHVQIQSVFAIKSCSTIYARRKYLRAKF